MCDSSYALTASYLSFGGYSKSSLKNRFCVRARALVSSSCRILLTIMSYLSRSQRQPRLRIIHLKKADMR